MSLHSYAEPTRQILRGAGQATELGSSRVQYVSFERPEVRGAPPLVLFGGAFQTYWSFKLDVERLGKRWPVIVINLPGQGMNTQPSDGLDFTGFADLTRRFLDHHDIDRIIPIGLSYGSAIAHRFATRYPERTEQLIVGGIARRLQPSLRSILRAARWLAQQQRHEAWGWSCVFHLINMEARERTGVSDQLLKIFHRSLVRLPEEARERWWTNSARLFTEELTGAPTCRTLVFGCRHDHFLPPFNAAEIARACPNAEFAVLQHADHLAPLERPDAVIDLYEAFLDRKPLADLPWLLHGAEAFRSVEDRRVTARAPVQGVGVQLTDVHGRRYRITLRNLGPCGAGITWDERIDPPTAPEPLRIRLESESVESYTVFCPDSEGRRIRFLFADADEQAAWSRAVGRLIGTGAGAGGGGVRVAAAGMRR